MMNLRLNKALLFSIVLNSLYLVAFAPCAAQAMDAPGPETQSFVLSGISYQKDMRVITQTERTTLEFFAKETAIGQLRWHKKTEDELELEIEFISFEYKAEPKERSDFLQKNRPFKAMVTMVSNQQPSLKIVILPQGPPPNAFLQQRRHGIIVMILEMLLPPAIDRKLTVSPDGNDLSMEVLFPEKTLVEHEQKPVSVDTASIRPSRIPSTFSCLPVLEDGRISGWELSDLSVSSKKVKYFRRFLDEASGLATRATNLNFGVSEKAEKAKLLGLIDGIGLEEGHLNPYENYYLYELRVTDTVETEKKIVEETEEKSADSDLPLIAYALTAIGFGAGIVFAGVILMLRKKSNSRGK